MGRILSDSMRKYIVNSSGKGYTKEVRSVYNKRIVEYARKGLEDLAFLAENLPEELQANIFNKKAMAPLFNNVFRLKVKDYDDPEVQRKRKRILRLCYDVLSTIGFRDNAWNLAADVMRVLIKAGLNDMDTIIGLKGIYIKSMSEE